MDPADLVRGLYRAYQARDWDLAATLLQPDAVLDMPATAERLVGRGAIIEFQRSYPEPWGVLSVGRVVAGPAAAAAEVTVDAPSGRRFAFGALWSVREGLLERGTEYWVGVGGEEPPAERAASPATLAARAAWRGA